MKDAITTRKLASCPKLCMVNLRYWTCCSISILILFLSACTSPKKILYFQDARNRGSDTISMQAVPDHIIKAGDILQITIASSNAEADQLFNAINRPVSSASDGNIPGIVVDKPGYIDIPYAGHFKISDMTVIQARDSIQRMLTVQLKDPIVNLRIANFHVSVLGDVARPGTFTIPNERINILQAISLAGDLNITGKRNEVQVIREVEGKKIFTRVDLRSKYLVQSDFFYLRSNDMVYVEPSKNKITQNDARTFQIVSLGATLLSLATIIFIRADL
jgi:polysaccharide biosynthesis/export protein